MQSVQTTRAELIASLSFSALVRVAPCMKTIKLTQTRNYTHAISVANSLIRIATCLNTFELTQKRSRSNAVSEASALVV